MTVARSEKVHSDRPLGHSKLSQGDVGPVLAAESRIGEQHDQSGNLVPVFNVS